MHRPYPALAIANYFINRALAEGQDGIDPMKLQKLVYYSQGWNLALNQKPLVNEAIEAWKYGPVVPSLYRKFKAYGADPIDLPGELREFGDRWEPEVPQADQKTIALLDRIWDTYGRFTGPELSTMTHKPGSPWEVTRQQAESDGVTEGRDIPQDLIREYFSRIASRASAPRQA